MERFAEWLSENTRLSASSIYKYSRASNTISKEMLERNVISRPLAQMEMFELEVAISIILLDVNFRIKDKTGNSMYSNALKQYRAYRKDTLDYTDTDGLAAAFGTDDVKETERLELTKSRIGQGIFRQRTLEKYNSRCIISGIDLPRLLIASHIKPWAVSSNSERLDANNGLCLSASYDRMFDIGLISFSNNGKLLISSQVSSENAARLHITNNMFYDLKPIGVMSACLEYHRDTIFIR